MTFVVVDLGVFKDLVTINNVACHGVTCEVDCLGIANGEWPVDERPLEGMPHTAGKSIQP